MGILLEYNRKRSNAHSHRTKSCNVCRNRHKANVFHTRKQHGQKPCRRSNNRKRRKRAKHKPYRNRPARPKRKRPFPFPLLKVSKNHPQKNHAQSCIHLPNIANRLGKNVWQRSRKAKEDKARNHRNNVGVKNNFLYVKPATQSKRCKNPKQDVKVHKVAHQVKNAFLTKHPVNQRNANKTAVGKNNANPVNAVKLLTLRTAAPNKNARCNHHCNVNGKAKAYHHRKSPYLLRIVGNVKRRKKHAGVNKVKHGLAYKRNFLVCKFKFLRKNKGNHNHNHHVAELLKNKNSHACSIYFFCKN